MWLLPRDSPATPRVVIPAWVDQGAATPPLPSPGQGPSASQPPGCTREPRFLFGLRAPLPPGPGARRGRVSERRWKHPLNFGISTRFQQSPHKLSLAPTAH